MTDGKAAKDIERFRRKDLVIGVGLQQSNLSFLK